MKDRTKNNYKLVSSLKNNAYMLKVAYKACPKRVCLDFLMKFLSLGRQTFYSIVFLRVIINALEKQLAFYKIVTFIIISTAVYLLIDLLDSWYTNKLRPITDQVLYEKINILIFNKATEVELSCFENPDFYNTYTKAASEANERVVQVLDNMTNLTAALISSIFIFIIMISLDSYAILFCAVPIITTYTLGRKINNVRYNLYMSNVSPNRCKEYIKRTVYFQSFAKEIRLSNIYNVLNESFNNAIKEIINNVRKYGFKLGLYRMIQDNINQNLMLLGPMIYATVRMLVFKTLMIGDYIVLVNSIVSLSWSIVHLSQNIIQIQEQSLYIDNLKAFVNYMPKISESQEGLLPKKKGSILTVNNISFTYDGQVNPTLKHISFELKPKEKIAIVGHNGAGKTTLIKLLLRLYDVTEGEISLDGENIKNYNLKEYRKLFATVFQDCKVMSMPVIDNVIMGNDIDKEEAIESLKKSGIYDKVIRLKNGVDTNVTKEFDDEGVTFSGGENQKISIARAYARAHLSQIAILDEPSSALDPMAEYQMFEKMMEVCKDMTVIFISHRLSSTLMADKIFLIENGEIIEQGSHSELMMLNGKYAEMFTKQAENYVDRGAAS